MSWKKNTIYLSIFIVALFLCIMLTKENRNPLGFLPQSKIESDTNISDVNKPTDVNESIRSLKDLTSLVQSTITNKPEFFDLDELVSNLWDMELSYKFVKNTVDTNCLPMLYHRLNDEKYMKYWPTIANIIGIVSDDVNSVPILIDYFQRDDCTDWNIRGAFRKMNIPLYIGRIGGRNAKEFLLAGVTLEGATQYAAAWLESYQWSKVYGSRRDAKLEAINKIRYMVLQGMACLQEDDTDAVIEQLYSNEMIKYENNQCGEFATYDIGAMEMKEHIKDIGVEAYLSMTLSELLSAGRPYRIKYNPSIAESVWPELFLDYMIKKGIKKYTISPASGLPSFQLGYEMPLERMKLDGVMWNLKGMTQELDPTEEYDRQCEGTIPIKEDGEQHIFKLTFSKSEIGQKCEIHLDE